MNNGYLSVVGLLLLVPVAILLMGGQLSAGDAAQRALVLVVVLVAIDRVVLPTGRFFLDFLAPGEPAEPSDDPT